MAGGYKKIDKHPNAGKGNFKANPQNAGRKKKKYSQHIREIKRMGYEPPSREEYFEFIGMFLVMEEDDLKAFAQDKTRPYWMRLIVLDMNNKATRQRMMSDYRDWLFGRPENKVDVGGVAFMIKPKKRTGGKDDRG